MIFCFYFLVFSVLYVGTEGGDCTTWCPGVHSFPELVYCLAGEYQIRNMKRKSILNYFCWNKGGWLAELEARVDNILAVYLDYWIGLTDFAHEGMKDMEFKNQTIFHQEFWIWQESHEEAPPKLGAQSA